MINVVKLIIVNLLGLFDLNKILIARDSGVKSNNEKKLIIVGILIFVIIYILNTLFKIITFDNPLYIFIVGFIISTIISIIVSRMIVEDTIFKSNDIDMLFSLPLTKNQIIFSKLFSVFIRNIVLNIVIMLVCSIKYYSIGTFTQSLSTMIVMSIILLSIIPIVIISIYSYLNNYFKYRYNNVIAMIFRLIVFIILGIGIYYVSRVHSIIGIINRVCRVYPIMYLVKDMFINDNNIMFIIYILINIGIMIIYSYIVSDNYSKICSLLKGVKKSSSFKLKRLSKKNKLFGYIRKDIRYLFNNKIYFSNVMWFRSILSVLLIILFISIPYSKIGSIPDVNYYINRLVPVVLSTMCTLGCFNICSISMEKDNINMVKTMPIKIGKVLLSKWICGVLMSSIFILINGTLSIIYFRPSKYLMVMVYLMPLCFTMFIEALSLLLDYRFIIKDEINDNVIVRQRVISYIPTLISIILLGYFTITIGLGNYKYMQMGLSVLFIIGCIVSLIYYLIFKKKLLERIMN